MSNIHVGELHFGTGQMRGYITDQPVLVEDGKELPAGSYVVEIVRRACGHYGLRSPEWFKDAKDIEVCRCAAHAAKVAELPPAA